jgi:hypothetical protein
VTSSASDILCFKVFRNGPDRDWDSTTNPPPGTGWCSPGEFLLSASGHHRYRLMLMMMQHRWQHEMRKHPQPATRSQIIPIFRSLQGVHLWAHVSHPVRHQDMCTLHLYTHMFASHPILHKQKKPCLRGYSSQSSNPPTSLHSTPENTRDPDMCSALHASHPMLCGTYYTYTNKQSLANQATYSPQNTVAPRLPSSRDLEPSDEYVHLTYHTQTKPALPVLPARLQQRRYMQGYRPYHHQTHAPTTRRSVFLALHPRLTSVFEVGSNFQKHLLSSM